MLSPSHLARMGFILAAGLLLVFAAWLGGCRFGDEDWPVDADSVRAVRTW